MSQRILERPPMRKEMAFMEIDPLIDRWWILWRRDPLIRSALLHTLADSWPGIIRGILNKRRALGLNFTEKAISLFIAGHRATLTRYKTGELPIELDRLYGLASLTNVEIDAFLPASLFEFLQKVTLRVGGRDLDIRAAQAYAAYMLVNPSLSPLHRKPGVSHFDSTVVALALDELHERKASWTSEELGRTVELVAKCLRHKLSHLNHGGYLR